MKEKQLGFSNSWTMPIKGRIDILATGIRTPIGIKVFGPDLDEISRIAREIEQHVGMVEGTRSVFAERVSEGYYLHFNVHRDAIARYGLTVADVFLSRRWSAPTHGWPRCDRPNVVRRPKRRFSTCTRYFSPKARTTDEMHRNRG